MARIPQERIDAMKRQVDLLALVQSHGVVLKQHGRNWKGICPFHDDTAPSLVVTPDKHLWNCLGCDAGGDVYQWMMKTAKVSFRRAHEMLHDRFGNGSERPPISSKGLEIPVDLEAEGQTLLRQVVDYYHARLDENPAAIKYLEKRGIGDREAIDRFKIGFSDRSLGMRLPVRKTISGDQIRPKLQDLGIFRQSGHEHFTGSIVIPVFDKNQNVCEIYGRKIASSLNKGSPIHTYLDSESRPTSTRGVFNFDRPIDGEEVILCESIIDALTFWCAGYRNVTTSYGTNGFNAQDHLAAYERNNIKKVFIAYDNDSSGNEKGQQVAERLLASGYGTSRVKFPAGMDANQYARKVTPAAQSLGLVLRKANWLGKGELLPLASKTQEAAKPRRSVGWRPRDI
jgi:DNA primase catalytic core